MSSRLNPHDRFELESWSHMEPLLATGPMQEEAQIVNGEFDRTLLKRCSSEAQETSCGINQGFV